MRSRPDSDPQSVPGVLLGVDVGTTTIKAATFAADDPAEALTTGRADAGTRAPRPGWSETDPELLWKRTQACIREALRGIDPSRVVAIGVSGTACGAWLFDRRMQPVRPAVLWNDGRAAAVVDSWHHDGTLVEVFDRSGNVPFPGYTMALLRWFREYEPATVDASAHLLFCKDYVRYRLTGVLGTDATDPSYVPFDIRARRWDDVLAELCGVTADVHLLPEIHPDGTSSAILDDVAADLGLPPGVAVALGATDIVAGCVGGGAAAPGTAVTILGTSANSSMITELPEFEPPGVGIMAAGPLAAWTRTMLNTSGSATLDWMAGLLTGGDVETLAALAADGDATDRPVLVPYLSNAGVVSPVVNANARGALSGLRVHHGRPELARAAFEGLALAVADSYTSMPADVRRITAIGGAARSDLLLQTIADATGAVVVRPRGTEFGARGVALLAAHAIGEVDDVGLRRLSQALPVDREFTPRQDEAADLKARYAAASQQAHDLGGLW